MTGTRRSDRYSLVLVACFTLVATILGVHTGYRTVDVDEVVYRNTIVAMRTGRGYYPAMRDALVAKEGAPPSQIRSVRPPTLYVFLSRFPPGAWRSMVGVVYLAILLSAWRLGRPLHPYGGTIAVSLTGMWVLGAAPVLFLHTELWGLPFLLAGVIALRNRRWTLAALALATAAILREIYVLPLLIGLLISPRRRPWIIAIGVVVVLGLLHAHFAGSILSAQGREAAFGKSGLSPAYVLSALGASDRPLGWLIGIVGGVLGVYGLRMRWAEDAGARVLLPFVIMMVPLTVFVGREYWGLAFGPALACFAPASLTQRSRSPSPPHPDAGASGT